MSRANYSLIVLFTPIVAQNLISYEILGKESQDLICSFNWKEQMNIHEAEMGYETVIIIFLSNWTMIWELKTVVKYIYVCDQTVYPPAIL